MFFESVWVQRCFLFNISEVPQHCDMCPSSSRLALVAIPLCRLHVSECTCAGRAAQLLALADVDARG
jgi:hypothetical protein